MADASQDPNAPAAGGSSLSKAKTPAGPSKGTSVLPVARVSKIVKSDKDIAMCSKEALFLMSVATEEFLKKLTLASYTESRANKRKGVQYKDLSTAIQQDDAYFYLQEVIPPPMPVEKAVKARKKKMAEAAGDVLPPDPEEASAQDALSQSRSQAPAAVAALESVQDAPAQVDVEMSDASATAPASQPESSAPQA